MANCTQCGSENLDGAKFCCACGGRVEAQPAPAPAFQAMRGMAPVSAPKSFGPMRGMASVAAPRIEDHSAMRGIGPSLVTPDGAHYAFGKTPGVATFFSFIFPGGGQFYNGDTRKGLMLLGIAFVAFVLTVEMGIWYLGMPLSLGAWLWGMMDAGKVARQQKALG